MLNFCSNPVHKSLFVSNICYFIWHSQLWTLICSTHKPLSTQFVRNFCWFRYFGLKRSFNGHFRGKCFHFRFFHLKCLHSICLVCEICIYSRKTRLHFCYEQWGDKTSRVRSVIHYFNVKFLNDFEIKFGIFISYFLVDSSERCMISFTCCQWVMNFDSSNYKLKWINHAMPFERVVTNCLPLSAPSLSGYRPTCNECIPYCFHRWVLYEGWCWEVRLQ